MVTVGIPFFNDERYLDLAIRSVLEQSYRDFKLILLDDGSSDSSLQIAKGYECDQRVTVISDGINKGLPTRLNQIIDLAGTKYIARMDADDIMHPDRLAIQLEIMEKNPKIDVLGANCYTIDAKNIITGVRYPVSDRLVKVSGFIHPSVFAKSEWYKRNQYNAHLTRSQDSFLWQQTKSFSCFVRTCQPLLFYRELGVSYADKHRKTSEAYMELYRSDSQVVNRHYVIRKALVSKLKYYAYRLLFSCGLDTELLARRNQGVLSADEISSAQKRLRSM